MHLFDKGYAYVKRYREIVDVMIRHGFGYLVDRFGLRPFRSLREKEVGTFRCDLPPVVVPSFKLGWWSSQARDPGGA